MRGIGRIALLALALAVLASGVALAAAGDADIADYNALLNEYSDSLVGACAMDGTLYLCGVNHIFTYRPGDAELSAADFSLEVDEDEMANPSGIVTDGETVYALCPVAYVGDGDYSVERLDLVPVEIDGGEAIPGDPYEIDVDDLLVNLSSGLSYLPEINACCWAGGHLVLCLSDGGQASVYAIDPEDGYGWFVEDLNEPVCCIAPYGEDQVLIACSSGSEGKLYLYDPAEDELEDAVASARMTSGAKNLFAGLAYSEEDDKLFYLDGGSVMAANGLDLASASAVASISMDSYLQSTGMVLPGGLYAYCGGYEGGVAIRATQGRAAITARLVVKGADLFSESAQVYNRFTAAHEDVDVVMNDGAPDSDKLIEAMMGRDSSVDVYLLPVESEAYDALYNRDFMVPFTDPELTEAAAGMYPAIQDAIMKKGALVALPVAVSGEILGLDYAGFEQLGIAREDVPQNWPELLEFLPEVQEKIPEDQNILIFDLGFTQAQIREKLLREIMTSWRSRLVANGQEPYYNDPALAEALDKLMALDMDALDLPRDEREMNEVFSNYEGSGYPYRLLQFDTGCTFGSFYNLAEPVTLAIAPGEEGLLPVSVTAAIINPYSKNRELAQDFIVELLHSLSQTTLYSLSDALNEPVIQPRAQQMIREAEAKIEQLKAQLETADALNAPAIEASIAEQENTIQGIDRFGWIVAQKDIDWYRAHAENLTVKRFDYLSADSDGELADLARQLLSGRMKSANFLKEVDKKVRMRQAEGY